MEKKKDAFWGKKLFAIATLAGLAACATPVPVNKEVGALNFDYVALGKSKPTGKSIAIVSPQFVAAEVGAVQARPALRLSPYQQLMVGQTSYFYAQTVFQSSYQQRLNDAMANSIQEIISRKGFTTKGPYTTFDDIPFGDKKTIYLTAVPTLKVYFDQKPAQSSCKGIVCTEQGEFTVTGELVYKMIEPLTGQALMTKRINLSDFAISKNYIKDTQVRPDSSLLEKMIDKATAPDQLRDNTDRVMTEALNEFFKKAMAKIDAFVSTEELMSFNGDVENLKGLKRF